MSFASGIYKHFHLPLLFMIDEQLNFYAQEDYAQIEIEVRLKLKLELESRVRNSYAIRCPSIFFLRCPTYEFFFLWLQSYYFINTNLPINMSS